MVFEMLSINLYEFIKRNNFHGTDEQLVKRFAIQLIISLAYLKERQIVHCDLKPENILLRTITKPRIKVIDFGTSTYTNKQYYTYI
jgi:dual specificity tyrosine-phosphorylation-regulated kinase 2/3/4